MGVDSIPSVITWESRALFGYPEGEVMKQTQIQRPRPKPSPAPLDLRTPSGKLLRF